MICNTMNMQTCEMRVVVQFGVLYGVHCWKGTHVNFSKATLLTKWRVITDWLNEICWSDNDN
jgi:hypothetical protein